MTNPSERRYTPERSAAHRVYMPPQRSAATRPPRKRRNGRLPIIIGAALAIILIAVLLIVGEQRRQWELHRFDGYPLRYTEEVQAAAAEFNVEPAYLYAVILAESSFRTDAVSKVGARGLMQIMPDTGTWLARKIGVSNTYTHDMLEDPSVNVRMGAWYLRFLLDRYHDDKRCASAAYHAGQGKVDEWLKDPQYSVDGQTLNVIAYESTNNYVNKVLKNYENYLELLARDD